MQTAQITDTIPTVHDDPITELELTTISLMHRGMRRDSVALHEALLRLAPTDRRGAARLATWFADLEDLIVHHHSVEDDILWPGLLECDPGFAEDEGVLVDDHHELDRCMRSVAAALDDLSASDAGPPDKERAVVAAAALAEILHTHLEREEATALDRFVRAVPRRRWVELEERAVATTDKRALPFVGPWLADHATPEEAARLLATVPLPVRMLVKGPWRRRYEKRAAHVRLARGATGSRGTRLRGVATAAGLLGAGLLLLGATACGSDAADANAATTGGTAEHGHQATGEASVDDGTVTVTMADYSYTPIEDPVAAGAVRFRAVNEGVEPHEVQIARPRAGVTAASFATTFDEQGEQAALAGVELLGGIHGVQPGTTVEGVADLAPGEYLLLCFFPAADGTSHIVKGMVDGFEVTRSGEASHDVHADATMTAADFSLAVPPGWDGKGLLELRNDGSVDHEVVFLRVDDGKAPADVLAWYGGGQQGPAPFAFTGGVAAVKAGSSGWVDLDLAPGTYMAVCFIPTPDGTPHALLGMISTFAVA